ncbi:UNVERIFIED_CONTAM: hypothetical protein FKN15_047204 [Acipenser sinensis]
MAQEEMDEIEETASSLLLDDSEDDKPSLLGVCMKYGTVNDLLSFANWVSNTPQTTLQQQKHEMGVVLNKVTVKGETQWSASNIVLMSAKAVLVDFGLSVQMTEDVYVPRDLRGTEIHKQAPPLEDIAEDCSPAMRRFLEGALERNPHHRLCASELLKDEALPPPREEQPRCWSLDSALCDRTRLLVRQESELPDTKSDSSVCSNEESMAVKRKGSLYIDLGALAGYYNIVRGPPASEYG